MPTKTPSFLEVIGSFPPQKKMIIYYFNDFEAIDEAVINQLLPNLPQQQQDAIAATKLLSRKREIAISYIMLVYALENKKEEIASQEQQIEQFSSLPAMLSPLPSPLFRFAEHGKPYLANQSSIFFNISHCKEAIATAVSNREIGIDIEGQRHFSDSLIARAFNDEERASVLNNEEPKLEFSRIWTRKESFFKWTGTGILVDHIKSVEQDATAAGCKITTQLITPETGNPFFLSIAI